MGGLDFKDFDLFNLALLAKEAWSVVQMPDSLSTRILKAAYFPCSILDANLGNHPSQIWRGA